MHNYKTEGIIIKRTNVGEADRVLTILTPYYGKIRVFAKGARKITSQRSPNLELFNQTSFMIHKGSRYEYVTEAKTIHAFEHIRDSLEHIKIAYQVAELINILTREEQELEEVYELVSAAFYRLNESMTFHTNEFKYKLLMLLGFLSDQHQEYDLDSYIEEIAQRRLFTKRIYE